MQHLISPQVNTIVCMDDIFSEFLFTYVSAMMIIALTFTRYIIVTDERIDWTMQS